MDRVFNQTLSTLEWFYIDTHRIFSYDDCCDVLLRIAAVVWNVFCTIVWFATLPLTVPTIILVRGIQILFKPSSPFVPSFQGQDSDRPDRLVNSVFGANRVNFPDDLAKILGDDYHVSVESFQLALSLWGISLTRDLADAIRNQDKDRIDNILSILSKGPVEESPAEFVPGGGAVVPEVGSISDEEQEELNQFWNTYNPKNFKVDDTHLFAVDLTIPPIDDRINISLLGRFFTFLQDAGKLPSVAKDDYSEIPIGTFCNNIIQSLDSLPKDYKNIIRHVLFAFTCRWKQIEAMPNSGKDRDLFYADMWAALKEIGLTLTHCINRQNTAYEDVFYEYVQPYLKVGSRITNKRPFSLYTLAELCQLRRNLFDQATSITSPDFYALTDVHAAGTKVYWRRMLGKTYGIPIPLSEGDFEYTGTAIKTYRDAEGRTVSVSDRIHQWFKEEYTFDKILKYMMDRCGNLTEHLQGERFEKWLRLTFPNFEKIRYALLDDDMVKYRPEIFVCLLAEAGVFIRH